jgi:O-antigen/teichoic acid export membrane protein
METLGRVQKDTAMLHKILKNSLTYGLGDLGAKMLTFFAFPIYANFFSVEEIGNISLISSLVSFLALFVSLGISSSVQRFYWESSEEARATVVYTGLISLLCSIGLLVGPLGLAVAYADPKALEYLGGNKPAILIAAASSSLTLILQFLWDLGRMRFRVLSFASMSFLRTLSAIGLTLALVRQFPGRIEVFFIAELASILLTLPLAFFAVRKDIKASFDFTVTRKLVRFGFPFVLAGAAYWIFTYIDRWMLLKYSTVTEVGLYSVASRYSMGLLILTSAFGQAWSPLILKLYSEDPNYHLPIQRAARLWLIGLSLAGLIVSSFSYELLRYTTPVEYWSAAPSFLCLTVAMVLSGTTQVTALGISLAKQSRFIAVGSWLTACVNILLNLMLIPMLGSAGASIATAISYFFLTTFYYYKSCEFSKIRIPTDGIVVFGLLIVAALLCLLVTGKEEFANSRMIVIKLLVLSLISLGLGIYAVRSEGVTFSSIFKFVHKYKLIMSTISQSEK